MAPSSEDDNARNGYDESTSWDGDSATYERPGRDADRRRGTAATITNVRVVRIETIAMTIDEEAEAVQALAVLVARYWREHPEQAA